MPNTYAEGPGLIEAAQEVVQNPTTDKKFRPQEIKQCIQKDSAPLVNLLSSQNSKELLEHSKQNLILILHLKYLSRLLSLPLQTCKDHVSHTSHLTQNVRQISDYKGVF